MMSLDFAAMPDEKGYFGEYGGQVIPPELKQIMDDINDAYEFARPRHFSRSWLCLIPTIPVAPALST